MRNGTRFVAVVAMVLGGAAGVLADVVIETVTVGNPGNADDTHGAGYGGVGYVYNIGKFRLVEVPQPECITPPFGMVAWWPFWEPEGPTAHDIVIGGDHHGTYKPDENGPTPVSDGMVGRALSFDGTDDYVEVSNVVGLDFGMGEGTIDAWIKTEAVDGSIVVKGLDVGDVGYDFFIQPADEGRLKFRVHGEELGLVASSGGTVNDGDWHHVAGTLSRSGGEVTLKIYIDGLEDGSSPGVVVGAVGPTDEELLIGAGPNGFFAGVIDEIEIFNRALAPEEIQAIFNAGGAGKCRPPECLPPPPDAVLWFPYDDPVGPIVHDIIGGLDGTLVGDPTPTPDGMVDGALSFDGVDDYVEVWDDGALDFGMGGGTIEAWIKTDADDGAIVVKGEWDWYYFNMSDGHLGFGICDESDCWGPAETEGTVNDGDWHHVAATLSRSGEIDGDVTLGVYIDGVLDATMYDEGPVGYIGSPEQRLLIGARPSVVPRYVSDFFAGVIDEMGIFNRALAPEEIQAIFDAGSAGMCRPPGCYLDIKPGACPNLCNRSSHGLLPAALLGTDEFDATMIDVSSILLSRADGIGGSVAPHEGPPGPHSVFEDVGTPFAGEPCDCHDLEGDGIIDLSLKFKTDDVVADLLLDELDAGALVELVVTGELLDETGFAASDCVRLVPPGTAPGLLTVQSSVPGAWVDVSPLDETLDGGGFTDFERTFPLTTVVTLTAERSLHGQSFVAWQIDGEMQEPGENTVQFVMDGSKTVKALYRTPVFWSPRQMGAETPLPGAEAP